ncbi:calcium binding and coiled-coil domain 2 [Chamberlinius hualienensis]
MENQCNLPGHINFTNVKTSYSAKEDLICTYEILPKGVSVTGDCVGIFKIGFAHLSECVAAAYVTEDVHSATFKADTLPKDANFYQFCYFNDETDIGGLSLPFTFSISEDDFCYVDNIENDFTLFETRTSNLQTALEKAVNDNNRMIIEKLEFLRNFDSIQRHLSSSAKEFVVLKVEKDNCLVEIKRLREALKVADRKRIAEVKLVEDDADVFRTQLRAEMTKLMNDKDSELAILNQKNEQLQTELTAALKESQTQKAEVEDLRKRYHDAVVHEATLTLDSLNKQSAVAQLSSQLEKQKEAISESIERIRKLEEKTNKDKMENESLIEKIKETENMLSAMVTSKSMVAGELEETKRKLAASNKEYDDLLKDHKLLTEDYSLMKESQIGSLKELDKLTDENLSLKKDNLMLKRESDLLHENISQLLNFKSEQTEENIRLKNSNNVLEKLLSDSEEMKQQHLEVERDLFNRIDLCGQEYRKKYLEWFKEQKRVAKLQEFIKGLNLHEKFALDSASTSTPKQDVSAITKNETSPAVDNEIEAKIRAEMENQLQKFDCSRNPTKLKSATARPMELPQNSINNDCDRLDLNGLHSPCPLNSLLVDLTEKYLRRENEMTERLGSQDSASVSFSATAQDFRQYNGSKTEVVVCPICDNLLIYPDDDLNDHIDSHFNNKCPICFNLYEKDLGFDVFEKHVDTHMH